MRKIKIALAVALMVVFSPVIAAGAVFQFVAGSFEFGREVARHFADHI